MSDQENPESPASPGPGAKLALAREQQGKTREQIASVLNIQLDKVAALETGQYEKLFSPVFARGYLRSYGKYLGLDGESLVREFEANHLVVEEPLAPTESLNVNMNQQQSVWPARLGLVVVLLLMLGLLYWFFSGQDDNSEPATEPPVDSVSTAAPSSELNSSDGVDASAQRNSDSAMLQASGDVTAAPEANNIAEQTALLSDLSIGATSSANGTLLDELVLRFDDECWLEVLDANGDSLVADLQRQGTHITLHGVAPFNVKLGNPESVEIALNGSDVNVPDAVGGDKVVHFDVTPQT